jgi:uncharacterized protein YbjT (DUF2867 family)
VNGSALRPDVPIAMIATRDIGAAAAAAIAARDFTGVEIRDLVGPRDLTMAEATRILGAAIGKKDLPYVQFPYEAFAGALVQAGLSSDVARLYVEMSRAFNDGLIRPPARTPGSSTPTGLEAFARDFAVAYAAG